MFVVLSRMASVWTSISNPEREGSMSIILAKKETNGLNSN